MGYLVRMAAGDCAIQTKTTRHANEYMKEHQLARSSVLKKKYERQYLNQDV
jgi:hypothetical protein